jgi:uncharacterized repeat protein (TIGR01451 family)
MRISGRAVLVMLGVSVLLSARVSAQDVPTPSGARKERAERAAEEQQRTPGEVEARAGGAERDNPTERLYWQRLDRGIPSIDFLRNLRQQRRARQGRAIRPSITGPRVVAAGPVWDPIGPTGADYEQNGPSYLERDSGRARKILPHPTDPDTLYFLTSGGGLWVTHDFTASSTTWTPLTDTLSTTSGGSVAFGADPNVLYLGTGDFVDLVNVGGSMLKSTDGGATWGPEIDLVGAMSVRDIGVDTSTATDIVLVATDHGLFRSADAGATYAPILGGVGEAFENKAMWSLVQTAAGWLVAFQPCASAGGVQFVPAVQCGAGVPANSGSVYLSTDRGATWAPVSGNAAFVSAGRMTLAAALPTDLIVYAFAEKVAGNDQLDLFRSTDGGINWTALNINALVPANANGFNPNMDLMHAQSWYNQMILVDPQDAGRNTVHLGGDLSMAKTTDGGLTWTLTAQWNPTFGLAYVHADCHAAAFTQVGGTPRVLFGTDGGLFVSTDGGATWSSDKNNGLQTFLFYSLTSTPAIPTAVFGGSQDNGTRVRKGNTTIYNQSIGGDGIGTGWSQTNAYTAFGSVQGNSNRRNLTRELPDIAANWETAAPVRTGGEGAVFLTPMETPTPTADPTGKVFFTHATLSVFKTADGGISWAPIGRVGTTIPGGGSLRGTAHSVGVSPLDLLHIGVAGGSGNMRFTSDGGTNWVNRLLITLLPGFQGFASSVTWGDNQTIYVTSTAPLVGAVRVAKSTDGGNTWARADSGLPDVPTNRVVVDPRDATHNTLLAASDLGVYRSTDGGANWAPYGVGLPNVPVFDIYMPPNGSFARIATYGRGIWELPGLTFVSSTLDDSQSSCDGDGVLDNSETGLLTFTLRNDGMATLNAITAVVSSASPGVGFPDGATFTFPSAAGGASTTASVKVKLDGAAAIQQLDFNLSFDDPALNLPSPVTVRAGSFRANTDQIAGSSSVNDIEASTPAWTVTGTPTLKPDVLNWERHAATPLEHRWVEVNSSVPTDQALVSPLLTVGGGTFTITFEQHYSFEFVGGTTPAWFDGMVLEISTDAGLTWNDVGASASPGYDHVLALGGGNPIEGRSAYSGRSAGYPDFIPVTVNLGTTYQSQTVQFRFRVGTDEGVGRPGVEIRNLVVNGITNGPFTALVVEQGCATVTSLTSSPNPSLFGQAVTFDATVSGGLSLPTGTVTFKDGGTSIGTGSVDGAGHAFLSTSSLSVGSHTMTAEYGGDAAHAPSAPSPDYIQVVAPVPAADLSISKTDGLTSAFAGQVVMYAIVAANAGPDPALASTVVDAPPAALTGVTWTCVGTGGGTCAASGSGPISDTVDLPVGATVTYTLTGTIDPSATGTLANTATVAPPVGVVDSAPGNNSATDTNTIVSCASEIVIVPDGRLSEAVVPDGVTAWFGASVRIGNAYSVEFTNKTGNIAPGTLTLYSGDDACTGTSSVTFRDTSTIDPAVNAGAVRQSFTAAGTVTRFRAKLQNTTGGPVTVGFGWSDTTLFSAAWSTNSSYDTFYSFQNTTGAALQGTLTLLDTTGTVQGNFNLTIPAGQTLSTNTASLGVARNRTGTAKFTHDGPPGALVPEAAIANFSLNPAYVQPVKFQTVREAK